MVSVLSSILPKARNRNPRLAPAVSDDEDEEKVAVRPSQVANQKPVTSQATAVTTTGKVTPAPLPPVYQKRSDWTPSTQTDFGGGGAYPECRTAQFPLGMGEKAGGVCWPSFFEM